MSVWQLVGGVAEPTLSDPHAVVNALDRAPRVSPQAAATMYLATEESVEGGIG